WHPVRCELLFQDTLELSHTAPFVRGGKPRLAGHDATIGGDQDVLHVGPRDIGIRYLQTVDRLVDLVGEIDAIVGGEEPAACSVADEIGNGARTDFRTFESVSAVALPGRAGEEQREREHESDALSAALA